MSGTSPSMGPPLIGPNSGPFWAGTLERELRTQRCPDTGRLIWPPRPRSPYGQHRVPEWVPVSGRGSIWSFIVAHPPLLEPFASVAPYNVVVVALDEDPTIRMVGNLIAHVDAPLDSIDPATVRIGEPVRVVFDSAVNHDVRLPRWVRAEG